MERELSESRWLYKPEAVTQICTEELLVEIEELARKMDANLKRRAEWEKSTMAQVLKEKKRSKLSKPTAVTVIVVLSMMSLIGNW